MSLAAGRIGKRMQTRPLLICIDKYTLDHSCKHKNKSIDDMKRCHVNKCVTQTVIQKKRQENQDFLRIWQVFYPAIKMKIKILFGIRFCETACVW